MRWVGLSGVSAATHGRRAEWNRQDKFGGGGEGLGGWGDVADWSYSRVWVNYETLSPAPNAHASTHVVDKAQCSYL